MLQTHKNRASKSTILQQKRFIVLVPGVVFHKFQISHREVDFSQLEDELSTDEQVRLRVQLIVRDLQELGTVHLAQILK